MLGGALSPEHERKVDEVLGRCDPFWTSLEDLLPPPGPHRASVPRSGRPGRNDPCPCGSGRKYKRCHLASLRVLDDELGGFEVVSCDDRVRRNAAALGFVVVPARAD